MLFKKNIYDRMSKEAEEIREWHKTFVKETEVMIHLRQKARTDIKSAQLFQESLPRLSANAYFNLARDFSALHNINEKLMTLNKEGMELSKKAQALIPEVQKNPQRLDELLHILEEIEKLIRVSDAYVNVSFR